LQIRVKKGVWFNCGDEIYELVDERFVFQKQYKIGILSEQNGPTDNSIKILWRCEQFFIHQEKF
jgi:hypothetical protein